MDKREEVNGTAEVSVGPPVVAPAELRRVMGHFASGVVIVCGADRLGPVGLTCQSFFSLSLDPPLVALAPSQASTSWPRIAATGSFAVSILSSAQEALCRSFAISGADKFAGVSWRTVHTGSPIIEGALAWADCRIEAVHQAGDHFLVTARVLHAGHDDGHPLLFYRGTYRSLQKESQRVKLKQEPNSKSEGDSWTQARISSSPPASWAPHRQPPASVPRT